VVVSLPWIAAVLGFGVGGLWAPLGQPRLQQAVHPGEHHGLDGMLLALTALVLSRRIGAVNGRRLRWAARFYCAAMLAYGVANVLNDAWYEQLVKRGVVGWTVPSMILPAPNLAWAILLAAVFALVVLVFRAGKRAGSRTVPAAWALVLAPAILVGLVVGATHDASVSDQTPAAQLRDDALVAAIARGPTSHLYALRRHGSVLRQLTDADAGDAAPDWSPVRRELVFQGGRDGNQEIYAMRLDGAGIRRLTHDDSADGEPAWSPDGRRIAFVSDRAGSDDVYVMDADGSHVRRLTDDPHADEWPAWSPDGRLIAFDSDRAGTYDLYAVGPGGGRPQRLTATAADDRDPRWFPDGRRLAFESDRGGDFGLYVLGLASRRAHLLTGGRGADFGPAVSRDGRWIAFVSDRDGVDQLYVVRADGSGLGRLTSELADKGAATWVGPA
jgi:dipeptidyl aminopeptidase/acylaminoacyl peptidase